MEDQLTDVIINLQARGFSNDFIIEHDYIRYLQYNELIVPDDFEILEIHHFKRSGKFKDISLVYGIRLLNHDIKGILVSSYRSYTQGMSLKLWAKFDNAIKTGVSVI